MFYRQKVTGIYTVARACARARNPFCKNVNKICSLKSVPVSILPEQPLTLTYRTYYNAHKKLFFFFVFLSLGGPNHLYLKLME